MLELTVNTFDDVIDAQPLVVIEFWAEWCEPCKQVALILAEMAQAHPDVFFGRVNIEQETTLVSDFCVHSVPQLLIIKQGVVVLDETGLISAPELDVLIKKAKALEVAS